MGLLKRRAGPVKCALPSRLEYDPSLGSGYAIARIKNELFHEFFFRLSKKRQAHRQMRQNTQTPTHVHNMGKTCLIIRFSTPIFWRQKGVGSRRDSISFNLWIILCTLWMGVHLISKTISEAYRSRQYNASKVLCYFGETYRFNQN